VTSTPYVRSRLVRESPGVSPRRGFAERTGGESDERRPLEYSKS
jgi:hypothetical protein